ncbi:MAG: Clp protease ClpP [Eubacterium sp.]|nr:Clp protease ClpP [Candidatus Colimonas fimequi]
MIFKINGDIIGNDWKEVYDWFGIENTCPSDVLKALAEMPDGDRLQVKINSGGGDVMAGQEIYSVLRARNDVDIEVESIAASAASIIAMAGPSTISPVGMIMIHDVSTRCGGNKNDFKKQADTLARFDEALASAYVEKTGRTKEEILKMMDKETWLTAEKAVELGFINSITNRENTGLSNQIPGMKVTDEMLAQFNAYKNEEKRKAELKAEILDGLDKFGA